MLKYVNDNLNLPYRNPDGTPNYGIYFGDHETGGVMFITPKDGTTFDQRAWHGSGMDFNEFNLKRPLPVPGIWYTAGAFTRPKQKDGLGV